MSDAQKNNNDNNHNQDQRSLWQLLKEWYNQLPPTVQFGVRKMLCHGTELGVAKAITLAQSKGYLSNDVAEATVPAVQTAIATMMTPEEVLCRKCWQVGHYSYTCTNPTKFKQLETSSNNNTNGSIDETVSKKPNDKSIDQSKDPTVKKPNDQVVDQSNEQKNNNSNNQNECCVCMNNTIDCCIDCGHVCMCMTCADQTQSCPICRHNIQTRKKIYLSSSS